MQLFNNFMDFGGAACLLMIVGLSIVSFFIWMDSKQKR